MEISIPTEKYFYPMSVSSATGHEDTLQEILFRWDKFDLLDDEGKEILISKNVPIAIKKIATQFNLAPASIEEISRLIREVYFKSTPKNHLAEELIRRIPSLNILNAQKISQFLNQNIFLLKLSSKEETDLNKQKSTIITLVISDALIQYPKLAEQAVTANLIKLQNYPAPVRPCVKNWIADFHYAMGSGKHSPIERGNYLFHSENGKVLTAPERQKLGMILKSLDEQTLLTIDPVREVIVFEDAADIAQTNNGSGMNHGSGRTYDSQNISTGAIVNSGPGNALDSRLRGNDKVGNTQSSLSAGQVSRFQTGNTRDPLPVGSADNSTNEFAQRQDNLEKFYQAPQSTQVAPQQMQTDKPPVVLKNISFSPGLVVVPKINDAQNENDTNKHTVIPGLTRNPERGKDLDSRFHGNDTVMNDEGNSAYYSIPGSKPPIGSSDFHQNSIAIHPVIERNIQPGNVPNSLPIQPAMSTGQMNGYEENNNGNVAQTGATQDRDSLSDEMLLKLYQERKQQKNVSSPNFAQSQNLTFTSPQKLAGENPYHITSTNGEEKGVNQKNVVNLKN